MDFNNTFIMLVGLPASGKSTLAQEYAEEYHAVIESSDAMREELFGDVSVQDKNKELFEALHKRIKEDLAFGLSVVYDACNISYKRRKAFLDEIKNLCSHKICVVMCTPYDECIKRNMHRERVVPRSVIERMYMNFNIPYWYEGWDEIKLKYTELYPKLDKPEYFPVMTATYNQQNSHHKQSLGMHSYLTAHHFSFNTPLYYAGLLHDCGKEFTQVFHNAKGEPTKEAHYYNHQYVGCYESLFFDTRSKNLEVATLIMWHMEPYFFKEQKTFDKYKNLWGEELYNDILLLHMADDRSK
jgi:predicted kinase